MNFIRKFTYSWAHRQPTSQPLPQLIFPMLWWYNVYLCAAFRCLSIKIHILFSETIQFSGTTQPHIPTNTQTQTLGTQGAKDMVGNYGIDHCAFTLQLNHLWHLSQIRIDSRSSSTPVQDKINLMYTSTYT
jgi:hypothetical protein